MADLVDIACTEVRNTASEGNKTKYGRYTGTNGASWNWSFISWCAKQADISEETVPKTGNIQVAKKWFKDKKRLKESGYTPVRNDVVFYKNDKKLRAGIVEQIISTNVYFIEGDLSGKVARNYVDVTSDDFVGIALINGYINNSNADNYKEPPTTGTTPEKDNTVKKPASGKEELEYLQRVLDRHKKDASSGVKKTYEIKAIKPSTNLEITLFYTHNKKRWNLPVKDGLKVTWERRGAPGKIEFTTIIDDKHIIHNGDSLNLLVNGKPFFYGFVFKIRPSADGEVAVLGYDQLRYFKNKDSIFYKKKTATRLLKTISNTYKLQVGKLANTKYVVSRSEQGKTLFDIIENCLTETTTATGRIYTLYDSYGKLRLREPWKVDILIDETTGQNYNYSASIDGNTYDQIKLAYENKNSGTLDTYIAKSSKNINKWGILQYYEKINTPNVAKKKAKVLLKMYNSEARTLSISGAFGSSKVRAGCLVPVVMDLYDVKISYYMLVDRVVHTFENMSHTMDLDLSGGDFNSAE